MVNPITEALKLMSEVIEADIALFTEPSYIKYTWKVGGNTTLKSLLVTPPNPYDAELVQSAVEQAMPSVVQTITAQHGIMLVSVKVTRDIDKVNPDNNTITLEANLEP